jgi:hypothetical protein
MQFDRIIDAFAQFIDPLGGILDKDTQQHRQARCAKLCL